MMTNSKRYFILPLLLLSFLAYAQEIDIYDEMYPILEEINHFSEFGNCSPEELKAGIDLLNAQGYAFKSTDNKEFRCVNEGQPSTYKLDLHTYLDPSSAFQIQLVKGDLDSLNNFFQKVRPRKGWTGYESFYRRFVYMVRDTTRNSLAGALLIGKDAVFSITRPLSFAVKGRASTLAASEKAEAKEQFNSILEMVELLGKNMVPQRSLVYKSSDEQLTPEERVFGFTHFWTEVKYNFAFFDQVPDLNWDEVYQDYLPIIMKDQSNVEYFKNMELICALLKDGHTNIYLPWNLPYDYPALSIFNIGQKAYIGNMDKSMSEKIPKGTEITAVDGIPTQNFLKDHVIPYISSSTEYILWRNAAREMLKGKTGTDVVLKLQNLEGEVWEQTFTRNRSSKGVEWAHEWPQNNGLLEMIPIDNNTVRIKLNTFANRDIVGEFEKLIDTLQNFDRFIIDLRSNGGGNSGIGHGILKYFADKDFATSKWSTREHQASFKAWGSQYVNAKEEDLDEWQLKAKQIHDGSYWYVSEPDTIEADKKINFKGDLIVLISNNTASAAEDFLVALDDLGFGKLVGQPTFGSTGQPLLIRLPRGGNARICTKKDTYPDGREFVGYGIQPDIYIEKTLETYLSGEDIELKAALELIKEGE